MSHKLVRLALTLVTATFVSLIGCSREPEVVLEGSVAFVDVNVVPMDREQVIARQTVVVHQGRIITVGPYRDVEVPGGAQEVDGRGKFLMPALAEMHGHLPSPQMLEPDAKNMLFLYVANGVTSVRGMQGHPSQFNLRTAIDRGQFTAPRLFLSSPAMRGGQGPGAITTPEQAAQLIREYKVRGYDLVKVQEDLAPNVYDAIAATSREVGIPFGGHVSDHVGLRHAIASGQVSVDHLDNYVEALVPDAERQPPGLGELGALVGKIDESKIAKIVQLTRDAGMWVVPTMVLWESAFYGDRSSTQLILERPEVKYMPPETVEIWKQAVDDRLKTADLATNRRVATVRRRLLKALHDGGAKILLGTDSPQIFSVPGFSIHREMKLWVEVGMTPYQVLESGTRHVAEYFNAAGDEGTVAPGRRADLLLLTGNPLDDVGNVARRAGVMLNGRWIPEEEIQSRLADIAAYYGN
jgi:imidazolonepropionase-like amidohydrolase